MKLIHRLHCVLASTVVATVLIVSQPQASGQTDAIESILLKPIVVVDRPGWLKEEAFIGEMKRPEWTSKRRFGFSRVYIQQDPGQVSVEQWWRVRSYRDQGKKPQQKFIEEIEIGLPWRMQLDIYADWGHEDGRTLKQDLAVELRWALADWGVIPLNPTLYAEYKATDGTYGSDVYELKLLLGDDFTPRLHWALNFAYERAISRARANEFAISQGISYTIIDQVLSAGLEMQYKYENEQGGRHNASGDRKFGIGPSFQIRPTPNSWINLVCMAGCSAPSPALEGFVIFGYNFGRVASGPSVSRPVVAPR
jgi:hypothetical protein